MLFVKLSYNAFFCIVMHTFQDLFRTLNRIDRKGYKAYKDIEGAYSGDEYELFVDYVQGDPFAAPSRLRVRVKNTFPAWTLENKSREIALRDFVTRAFQRATKKYVKGNRGSGKSGTIAIDKPGQEILERTSVMIGENFVEARFTAGLPAFGRKVAGRHAIEMIEQELNPIVEDSLFFDSLNEEKLTNHLFTCEDAHALREKLKDSGLIAFIAEHSILPRASGVDQRPLKGAIPFQSPESMRYKFTLPHREITGMGIPGGITLITGGGYHGKSTLLNAIERGIYNHIPGDGREFVVADDYATKIRAEDGRYIEKVDISPFINELPQNKDTTRFSSDNASGSTSQAANTIEALEAGASCLLIDEDTSATNFMIRDHRMQQLVPKEREPITPYIDKVQQLYQDIGVSTILVVGGSGSYFGIADKVICMVEYEPQDLTGKAKDIARNDSEERLKEGGEEFGNINARTPVKESINAQKGKKVKLKVRGVNAIQLGTENIDLSSVEQIVDSSQLNAATEAILYAKKYMDGRSLRQILNRVEEDIQDSSLDILSNRKSGDLAQFRRIELAAAINRLRTLKMK